MNIKSLLPILLLAGLLHAEEAKKLKLADTKVTLTAPEGWEVKKLSDTSIYPPTQPAGSTQSRIHLEALRNAADSLKAAVEAEIDSITKRNPESSNARKAYRGSEPVKTAAGLVGLRADFYTQQAVDEATVKYHHIVKYYFHDDSGKIFKICAHVHGDDKRMKMFEEAILANLQTK